VAVSLPASIERTAIRPYALTHDDTCN
jgi:hypothetical protein